MILNSASVGIYTFNSRIDAYNTVIADCGSISVLIQMGGTYNFYHCTLSNYSAYYPATNYYRDRYKPRNYPSLIFSNYFDWYDLDMDYRIIDVTWPIDLELNFVNSIIYGNKASEIFYDSLELAGLDYTFDHCLLKMHADSVAYFDTTRLVSIIYNEYPAFVNDSLVNGEYNFELTSESPAINAGDPAKIESIPQLESDFNGNPRLVDGQPDLGAYEHIE
jgi:hypothetical protein